MYQSGYLLTKNKDTPCGCPLFLPQSEALEYPSSKPFVKLEFVNLMSCDSACDFCLIHNGYGRVNALLYENELSRRACV